MCSVLESLLGQTRRSAVCIAGWLLAGETTSDYRLRLRCVYYLHKYHFSSGATKSFFDFKLVFIGHITRQKSINRKKSITLFRKILYFIHMRTKDRRFIKTENTIQKAMIKLLNEGDAEYLAIEDLIYEADINKSTFYLHYQSLELLISALEDEVISSLSKKMYELPDNHSRYSFFENLLSFIKENQKITKAVLNASTYRFNEKIEEFGKTYLIEPPAKKRNRLVSKIELLESALIQAIVAYLRIWIFDGCKFDDETVVADLVELTASNIYKDIIR